MKNLVGKPLIYTNDKLFGGFFDDEVLLHLNSCQALEIATGYFGVTLVRRLKPKMIDIAKRGYCKLLVGMIFNEGVTPLQKQVLEDLDESLRKVNGQSGVFVTRLPFHGKVYRFCHANEEDHIYVGSSNFSTYGFKSNLEFNVKVVDQGTKKKVLSFMSFIFKKDCNISSRLSEVILPINKKNRKPDTKEELEKSELSSCLISKDKFPSAKILSEIKIKLRVDDQPKSSLNLYFEGGRISGGKYKRRDWYEVEITSNKEDRKHKDYPIGEFDAYVMDDDFCYRIRMITASGGKKAIYSHEDRKIFGKWIKGKLEKSGILSFGERITSDTLAEYGRDELILRKFGTGKYYMEF